MSNYYRGFCSNRRQFGVCQSICAVPVVFKRDVGGIGENIGSLKQVNVSVKHIHCPIIRVRIIVSVIISAGFKTVK